MVTCNLTQANNCAHSTNSTGHIPNPLEAGCKYSNRLGDDLVANGFEPQAQLVEI